MKASTSLVLGITLFVLGVLTPLHPLGVLVLGFVLCGAGGWFIGRGGALYFYARRNR